MINRREKYREGLHSLYLPKYDILCSLLGDHWQPCQGFRSFQEQDALYDQCQTGGPCVTNARGGFSAHNYGCATDWIIFEGSKPVWIKHDDPRWGEYEAACTAAGLRWGKIFDDYPHNQLPMTVSWKSIGRIEEELGLAAALTAIETSVAKA